MLFWSVGGLIFSHATPVLLACAASCSLHIQLYFSLPAGNNNCNMALHPQCACLLLLPLLVPPATAGISEFLLVALAAPENSVTCVTQGTPISTPTAAAPPISRRLCHFVGIFAHFSSYEHGQSLHRIFSPAVPISFLFYFFDGQPFFSWILIRSYG